MTLQVFVGSPLVIGYEAKWNFRVQKQNGGQALLVGSLVASGSLMLETRCWTKWVIAQIQHGSFNVLVFMNRVT